MRTTKIMTVFGTRPEAIKMVPVIHALRAQNGIDVSVCITAQHRDMLDQVLSLGGVAPDIDLDLMRTGQTLDELGSRLLKGLGPVFDRHRPDRILVHGDTLTTMMATLAAYFRKLPVGHVEAGLRSGDIHHPWPEEVSRRVTACVADLNFAPTTRAAAALRAENIPASAIHVTGNTVIDALLATRKKVAENPSLAGSLNPVLARFAGKKIIAVTSHRRENLGTGMAAIADAIARIAARADVAIVFPVHPNPQVRGPMERTLGGNERVALIQPLDYPGFVALLDASHIVLTDSGGVQEEAPSFGKPVLVMRTTTERPEGVEAGTALLVGTDADRMVAETFRLLDDSDAYATMSRAHNPFGDGHAATRISEIIAHAHR